VGRTACHRVVNFTTDRFDLRPGQLLDIVVERALPHSLIGVPA
jgi:hypothetical protein